MSSTSSFTARADGDRIVTTVVEHNSVIRPVNHVCDRGCAATFVQADSEGYLDPREVRKAIRPETRLVLVNHASNVTGVVQDLRAIGAVCREAGVPCRGHRPDRRRVPSTWPSYISFLLHRPPHGLTARGRLRGR
jgi:selenocysteine lyase/cysteine desulfurase